MSRRTAISGFIPFARMLDMISLRRRGVTVSVITTPPAASSAKIHRPTPSSGCSGAVDPIAQRIAYDDLTDTFRTRHLGVPLDHEVKGKVGDVPEPFALSHGVQHFLGVSETKISNGIL